MNLENSNFPNPGFSSQRIRFSRTKTAAVQSLCHALPVKSYSHSCRGQTVRIAREQRQECRHSTKNWQLHLFLTIFKPSNIKFLAIRRLPGIWQERTNTRCRALLVLTVPRPSHAQRWLLRVQSWTKLVNSSSLYTTNQLIVRTIPKKCQVR